MLSNYINVPEVAKLIEQYKITNDEDSLNSDEFDNDFGSTRYSHRDFDSSNINDNSENDEI